MLPHISLVCLELLVLNVKVSLSDCILYNQNCISSVFKHILRITSLNFVSLVSHIAKVCSFLTHLFASYYSHIFEKKLLIVRLSPRPISTSQLHALLHFHSLPIYHLFLMGSYYLRMGYLILRLASCLDAFSTYLNRT